MIQALRPICCALALALLPGCGNFMRQSRTFDTTGTGGITIDASQRAIYSVKKTYKGGVEWTAFCAEPSPDALSALASSFGADVSAGANKALGLAGTNVDSTASIGLRTQTIQILRDAMYRLCEGYASGAMDQVGFTRMQRRYLHIMLALLAIEQITGPVVAQQVALTGSSSAGLGRGLGEIAKILAEGAGNLALAKSELSDAKTSEANLAKQVADSKVDNKPSEQTPELERKLVAAKQAVKEKATQLEAATTTYASLETKLKESERILLQASSEAHAFAPLGAGAATARSSAAITSVSQHVKEIVTTLVRHDYTKDVCIDVLLSKDGDDVVNAFTFETVAAICGKAHGLSEAAILKMQEFAAKRTEAVTRKVEAARALQRAQQPQPPTK